jgi:hypothetical protein
MGIHNTNTTIPVPVPVCNCVPVVLRGPLEEHRLVCELVNLAVPVPVS